ncbi:MAG: hypothetical protein HC890_00965 [Chloroflexaceae bacterium]|nr:hypothetical protein [Chloroflexaceae bacterium]
MARYTCSYIANVPFEKLQTVLSELLRTCNFDIIYRISDYMMAREIPGKVNFAKLVTVEVLIDHTTATAEQVQVNFVVKNEELPLQLDNHCRQMFDRVKDLLAQDSHWKVLEMQG